MPELTGLAQGGAAASPFYASPLILFFFIAVIWWFLLIRPQRQQEKKHRAMLDALKPGEKVVTTGGIYGVVAQLGEKTVKLKVADNVRIEVARSAIAGLQPGEGASTDDKPKES